MTAKWYWVTDPEIFKEQEHEWWYVCGMLREFSDDPNYLCRGDHFIAHRFGAESEANAFVEQYRKKAPPMTKQILEALEEVAAEQKDPERAGLLLAAYNRVLRLHEMDEKPESGSHDYRWQTGSPA